MRRRGGFVSGLVLRIVIWVDFRFESDHDRTRQNWAPASSEDEVLGHWIQRHWRDEDSEVGHCCRVGEKNKELQDFMMAVDVVCPLC